MAAHDAPRTLRIFVVENHDESLKYLSLFLEDLGHRVRGAASMRSALEELDPGDCDVLLSDIGLPDGDGWELLRRLQLPERVYPIAMSGLGRSADAAHSKAAGYRAHLIKPFDPNVLKALLDDIASAPACE